MPAWTLTIPLDVSVVEIIGKMHLMLGDSLQPNPEVILAGPNIADVFVNCVGSKRDHFQEGTSAAPVDFRVVIASRDQTLPLSASITEEVVIDLPWDTGSTDFDAFILSSKLPITALSAREGNAPPEE